MTILLQAGSSRSPALTGGDRYYGTVIVDSTVNFKIPVMEWWDILSFSLLSMAAQVNT